MTEQNSDAFMSIEGLPVGAVRENFQRINRIFKRIFRHSFGTVICKLTNLPPTPQDFSIDWNVIGKIITLQLPKVTGTKTDATAPRTNIPTALLPKQDILVPWYLEVNGASIIGWVSLDTTGALIYLAPGGWAAGAAEIGPGAFSYVGY